MSPRALPRAKVVDRLLGTVVRRGFRRGFAGDPVFLVVGACAWMVLRARRRPAAVVWQGRLEPGESLLVSSRGVPRRGASSREVPGRGTGAPAPAGS
ncbi:MAG: hypothetical protein ACYCUF_08885 [Acidimicrobiales bacterium]|nr:hypothetical protein [Actinomycetota bacterium]